MPSLAIIIPAAGSSSRFGRNKLLEPLDGKPVFRHTVEAFARRTDLAGIFVPTSTSQLAQMTEGMPVTYCPGGTCRAQSVLNALRLIPAAVEWVAVHDAARPLVSAGLIERTFSAAVAHGAAVPAMPVQLTIKQAAGPLPARVQRTLPRHELWAMQTPQVMRRQALLDAFDQCPIPLEQVTDDVQLLELSGQEIWLIPGEEQNLKITTPTDLLLAQQYLSNSP